MLIKIESISFVSAAQGHRWVSFAREKIGAKISLFSPNSDRIGINFVRAGSGQNLAGMCVAHW